MKMIIVCASCGAKNKIPPEKRHLTPKCGRCGASLAGLPVSGMVNSLTDAKFRELVEQASLPVLVDFYSPTCGPCRTIAPVIEAIAADYAGHLMVFKIDTSSQQMNAARFHIRGVPTLIFFNKGTMIEQIVGAVPRSEIEARIERIMH